MVCFKLIERISKEQFFIQMLSYREDHSCFIPVSLYMLKRDSIESRGA